MRGRLLGVILSDPRDQTSPPLLEMMRSSAVVTRPRRARRSNIAAIEVAV